MALLSHEPTLWRHSESPEPSAFRSGVALLLGAGGVGMPVNSNLNLSGKISTIQSPQKITRG